MRIHGGLSALALLGWMGLALTALPASAQQMSCDTNQDGVIDATEAATCDQRRFDAATGGQDEMTEEQFGAAYPDTQDGGSDRFGEMDEDASGSISRDEWTGWREQRFGDATQATGGEMPSADYETWEQGGSATDR
jgi:hypothetical protein